MAAFGGLEMYEIYEHLQSGGRGRLVKANPERSRLLDLFVKKGWDPEFLRVHFRKLGDKMLDEWVHWVFIQSWAKFYLRKVGLGKTMLDTLLGLGMTLETANKLVPICQSLAGSSYTDYQIVELTIDYALGKYDPISLEYFITNAENRAPLLLSTTACSTTLEPEIDAEYKTLLAKEKEKGRTDIYFHATSWKSCLSILHGVSHGYGRTCLDFIYRMIFMLLLN